MISQTELLACHPGVESVTAFRWRGDSAIGRRILTRQRPEVSAEDRGSRMSGLPEELRDWVGAVTGGAVTAAWPAGGGRPGFGIDVLIDGQTRALYLQRGRPQPAGSFLPIEREAEVCVHSSR